MEPKEIGLRRVDDSLKKPKKGKNKNKNDETSAYEMAVGTNADNGASKRGGTYIQLERRDVCWVDPDRTCKCRVLASAALATRRLHRRRHDVDVVKGSTAGSQLIRRHRDHRDRRRRCGRRGRGRRRRMITSQRRRRRLRQQSLHEGWRLSRTACEQW
jgi:hypothetical protein